MEYKEWSNPYNAFNSLGVLIHSKELKAIADQDFLPPVMVDIDPSNICNLKCIWCNSYTIRKNNKDILSEEHLIKIADFCKEWGVKSSCVAGGGEPLTNPAFNTLIKRLYDNSIEVGIISNGTLLEESHIEYIAKYSRWCGFSVDAGTRETYLKLKGKDFFTKVLKNIEKLTNFINKNNLPSSICFKFLIHPLNINEVYTAVKIAKDIGINDFHARPVGWDNLEITKGKPELVFEKDLDNFYNQIIESRKLEDENFKIYGISHKFKDQFKRKVDFERCWALPLLLTFGADGNYHSCFDIRGRKDLILGKHYPEPREILKVWNTKFHKDLIKNIDITKCPRCTFVAYNKIVEEVFIKDNMYRNFI